MKAKNLYTTLVLTMLVRFAPLFSQPTDDISAGISSNVVKGDNLEYMCFKDTVRKNFNYYVNVKYNEKELKKKYINPDPHICLSHQQEVSICSHDKVIEMFRQAFTPDKLNKLAKNSYSIKSVRNPVTGLYDSEKKEAGETIQVDLLVDDLGNILMISFVLDYNTLIEPTELEMLEMLLLKNIKVEVPVIDSDKNVRYSWPYGITATAKEIIDGEIDVLKRGCIKAEKRRKQREYGKFLEQQQQQ